MTVKTIVERVYTTLIVAIFLVIFSIVTIKFFIPKTIWMVGNFPYPTEYYTPKKVLSVIVSTLLLVVMFLMYYKLIIIRLNKAVTAIVSFCYILVILASEFIISSIAFHPIIGDYAIMKQGIVSFFEGDYQTIMTQGITSFFGGDPKFPDRGQLQLYPYNTHIVLLGGYAAKLFGNVDLAMKVLPIASITGSVVLSSLIVKKVTNFNGAHVSIVMSVLNILIYWQAPVFYTHTLVVFFLPATLYAYLCLKTANTRRKKMLWWIALGFFAACTYIIRPTALSVAVAILFESVFKYRKAHSVKVLSSVALCMLLLVSFNSVTTTLNLSTDNTTLKVPHSHWIKMGLNEQTYGVWNREDVAYLSNPDLKNTQDKDAFNKEIIVERLETFGVIGYMRHLNEKIEREWVSSQFSMYRIGEWFEQKNGLVFNIVANFSSTSYKIFDLYSFVIKLFILLGALAAAICYRKMNENEAEVLRICMTSTLIVFVFLLLWETAPHYSYEAWAFMNIPASLGLYKLFTMWNRKNENI